MGETAIKTLVMLPISDIYEHPDNPRKDLGDLSELTESVRGFGVLQNLTVVSGHKDPSLSDSEQSNGYTVIAGHRRLAAAGVSNVHAHRFRRTAATQALRRGMSIEMVSKYLRHENLATTMIYLDLSESELAQQHARFVV